MKKRRFRIPEIELHLYPPNQYILENQVTFMLSFIVGGTFPCATHVYRDNQNKIMLFSEGLLKMAKFRKVNLAQRMSESIAHEMFHAHIHQKFGKHFPKEEEMANLFANFSETPPVFQKSDERKCRKCGRNTFWKLCHLCSYEDLI